MKDKLLSYDPEHYLSVCAWCGKAVPEDTERFAVGGKAKEGALLRKHAGRVIIVWLGDREVPCLVVTPDSPAKKDGKDFIFMFCSEQCGREMKAAFLAEVAPADDLLLDSFSPS